MPTLQWNQRWKQDLAIWDDGCDGASFGDQWGDPEQVQNLARVRDHFLLPFVRPDRNALEIGSGGGRWTQYLLGCARVTCVDIHPQMFHYLLERFGARPDLAFCHTSGTDFPHVPEQSIDFAFSFGTFVHLDPSLIDAYLVSLRDVLRPGADLVLQYADKAKPRGHENLGFAPTTGPIVNYLLRSRDFEVVEEATDLLPHSNVVHARRV